MYAQEAAAVLEQDYDEVDYDPDFEDVGEGVPDGGHFGCPALITRSLHVLSEEQSKMARLPSELSKRQLGLEGERLAAEFLEREGYQILERNWRCTFGEMDIIARDPDGTVVMVEVKTRRVYRFADAMPEVAVNFEKRARYCTLASLYLMDHEDVSAIRFDVIGVSAMDFEPVHIKHLCGAFGWNE